MICWLKRLLHIDHAPMLDEVRRDEARGYLLRYEGHADRAAQIADRMAKASREAAERREN